MYWKNSPCARQETRGDMKYTTGYRGKSIVLWKGCRAEFKTEKSDAGLHVSMQINAGYFANEFGNVLDLSSLHDRLKTDLSDLRFFRLLLLLLNQKQIRSQLN